MGRNLLGRAIFVPVSSSPSRRRSLPSTRFQPRQALQALLSQRLRIGQMGYPVVRLNGCEPLVLQSAFRTIHKVVAD